MHTFYSTPLFLNHPQEPTSWGVKAYMENYWPSPSPVMLPVRFCPVRGKERKIATIIGTNHLGRSFFMPTAGGSRRIENWPIQNYCQRSYTALEVKWNVEEGWWCATHKQSWHTLGKSCCQRMCRKEGGPSKTVRMELNITVEIKGDYKNKTNGLTLSSFFRNSKTIVTLYCSLESVMLESFRIWGWQWLHMGGILQSLCVYRLSLCIA